MKIGDKVKIHPQISEFNKEQYPTISPYMTKLAGKEGIITKIIPSLCGEPEIYKVTCKDQFNSYFYRREWLITEDEDEIEISVNSRDIQNLLL